MVGGLGALVVAGVWAGLFPSLRHVDELSSKALLHEAIEEPVF
jgi:hypothetical protein